LFFLPFLPAPPVCLFPLSSARLGPRVSHPLRAARASAPAVWASARRGGGG
jgi:hypothetical protein